MTTVSSTSAPPAPAPGARPRWHRPLLHFAGVMVALALVASVGLVVDPREVLGAPLWAKPLKFAISTALYAVTLAWLIGQFTRFRRMLWVAGTATALALLIEMVIIVGYASVGDTSHFNVSTPLHTTAWAVMAVSIVAVWIISLIVAAALLRTRLGDRARTLAIRSGAILGAVGLGLAFLMTTPQGDQLSDFQGVAGAHTVGLADGGPGLPLLGWSTVGGDLRIPHFVGMHALQLLPLLAITLELLARRIPMLTHERLRWRLVAVGVATYTAAIALVTWQALAGQSIAHPAGPVLAAAIVVAAAALFAAVAVLLRHMKQGGAG